MTRAYIANEDRKKVIDAYLNNQKIANISDVLKINKSTIYRIIQTYKNENRIVANKRGGPRNKKLNLEHQEFIKSLIDDDCSITLKKITEKIHQTFLISVSQKTIDRCLSEFSYSLKRTSLIPERRNTIEQIEMRAEYATNFMNLLTIYDGRKLIFIDEAGFSVSMRSRRGRSLVGTRANHVVTSIRTRNISLFAAMNKQELLFYSLHKLAYNSETFKEALEQLFNKLREKNLNNCVFIADNVSFHKTNIIRKLFNNYGHTIIYLPPYSPFLNPIENLFSKWKEEVRQRRADNEVNLLRLINDVSYLISEENCSGWYRNMFSYILKANNREIIIN